MIEVIIVELMNRLKSKCAGREKNEPQNENPENHHREFLEHLESEIERLEEMKLKMALHQETLKMFHNLVSDILQKAGIINQENSEEPEKPEAETTEKSEDQPEEKEESETSNLTENERLEMLENGLQKAIGVLKSTKMVLRFKSLKQLLDNLTVLTKENDMPAQERIADIESGLTHAVKVLSESACAVKARITRDLREHLIKLLEEAGA